MTTLADLRAALRALLNDTIPGSYLWSDAALNLHINDAIRSYSASFPRHEETSLSTVAGQAEYGLPPDCIRVVRICISEYGGVPLQEGGDAFGEGYEVYGGKLLLLPAPPESGWEIAVRYLAAHALLALDVEASTVPAADEDLLLALAASQAIASLMVEEVKRQLLEGRMGQPASMAAEFHGRRYEDGVRKRLARLTVGRLVAT